MPGKGYLPDPPNVRVRRPHWRMLGARAGAPAPGSLPLSTNNRAFLSPRNGGPGVRDQQQTMACTGFAISSGMTLRNAIVNADAIVSAVCPYTLGRDIMRGPPAADGSLASLVDSGAEPSAVILGCQVYGVCSEADWPFDPSRIDEDPSPEQLEAADRHLFDRGYFLTEPSVDRSQTLLGLVQALALGYPVCAALPASASAFQSYSWGVLNRTQLTGDIDHYVLLVDYEWKAGALAWVDAQMNLSRGVVTPAVDPSLVIIGLNSWGATWGSSLDTDLPGGLFELSAGCIDVTSDLVVINTIP